MDPNASLAKVRRCAERLDADLPEHVTGEQLADLYRDALVMAEMFIELDRVIMREGRLPIDWHRAQLAAIRSVPSTPTHGGNPVDLGNMIAREGVDRCACGCKYWERDHCVSCGAHVSQVPTTQG